MVERERSKNASTERYQENERVAGPAPPTFQLILRGLRTVGQGRRIRTRRRGVGQEERIKPRGVN
jgi:hypothetical protein